MKKYLSLSFQASSKILDNVRWLSIDFVYDSIVHLCLGLSLLKERLIQNLIIATLHNNFRVSLEVGEFQSSLRRAKIKKNDESSVSFVLSTDELDYWLHFFLKYYRDGRAEVDHLDLEIEGTISQKGIYLTLKVDKALPPVSKEEARRRLGV